MNSNKHSNQEQQKTEPRRVSTNRNPAPAIELSNSVAVFLSALVCATHSYTRPNTHTCTHSFAQLDSKHNPHAHTHTQTPTKGLRILFSVRFLTSREKRVEPGAAGVRARSRKLVDGKHTQCVHVRVCVGSCFAGDPAHQHTLPDTCTQKKKKKKRIDRSLLKRACVRRRACVCGRHSQPSRTRKHLANTLILSQPIAPFCTHKRGLTW